MRQRWFQDDDGTYYRNFSMVEQELKLRRNQLLPWRWRSLINEVKEINSEGWISVEKIGRRDAVVQPRPLRAARPHDSRMWKFDEANPGN